MLHTLEQAIEATWMTLQFAQLLLEKSEEQKQQLASYVQKEQKRLELWQYTYFLVKGTYYEKKLGYNVPSAGDIVPTILLYEMKKAMLYYELAKVLSGAQKYAAERALQQALEHSSFFLTIMQAENVL